MKSGRADRRNIAHPDDAYLGLPRYLIERVLELLCRSKEERTADLEYLNARRNLAPAHRIWIFLLAILSSIGELSRNDADVGDFSHSSHKQKCGEHHSDFYRHGEI